VLFKYTNDILFFDGQTGRDYFVMGEAIGIVATLLVSFYYSSNVRQQLS
jgi:hypothetical protein